MKKQLLILFSISLFVACSSIKSTQEAINIGDYDKAIDLAIKNLKDNKTKKKKQPYVLMLEEAFQIVSIRDNKRVSFLKEDANPENLEAIYELYVSLKNRQQRIKPLLPLRILSSEKNAIFNFENYDAAIINSKKALSEHLYTNAKALFNTNNKFDYRKAYNDLKYIEDINPNFKDTRNLMEQAIVSGRDFVFVSMKNETQKVIPKRLEEDLLNFDTYGLNDLWTVYHNKKDSRINYDFGLELNLRNIEVSPEQVRERQIIKEKQVKDGFKYLLDTNGNQVKDSLGNKIKVDKLLNVRCEFYQFTQFKSASVVGQVKYVDLYTKQMLHVYPIESEFVFEHVYARHDGDKRALEESLLDLLILKAISFPTNERMIYDTGTDLKQKLKSIISRNKFRD
jgi:predicted RNA-binding protein with RPS1 domain